MEFHRGRNGLKPIVPVVQVGEQVVGEDTSCPYMITYKGPLSLYTIPSEGQYLAALEPFVHD